MTDTTSVTHMPCPKAFCRLKNQNGYCSQTFCIYDTYQENPAVTYLSGWVCPKCGSVYSPSTMSCPRCSEPIFVKITC